MSIDEQTRGRDYHNEIRAERDRLRATLDEINTMACYASEENIDSREEILLKIGANARAALAAISDD